MFHQRIKGTYSLVILIQLILFWLLFLILIGAHRLLAPSLGLEPLILREYPVYGLIHSIGFIWASLSYKTTSYRIFTRRLVEIIRHSYRQWVTPLLLLLFFLFLNKDQSLSRLFSVTFFTCWFVLLIWSWKLLPGLLAKWSFSGRRKNSVLFYGAPAKALDILPWVQRKHHIGFHVIGGVWDKPTTDTNPNLIPFAGETARLEQIIAEHHPDLLLVAELPETRTQLQNLVSITEKHGVRLFIHTAWDDTLGRSFASLADERHQFLYFREEPMENLFNFFIKRSLDCIISIFAIVMLLPIAACIVWQIQRRFAPGPLFFVQTRSGMNQQPFKMIKFRTMFDEVSDSEIQAAVSDHRVYPGGLFLRKFSIDEIPQFINVLKGEMSIIGPRAHLEVHNQHFSRYVQNYHVRKLVLPGITGLAQIRGYRGEVKDSEDIMRRLNSDIEYIENWSLSLDFWILLKTFQQVLFPSERAY